MVDSKADAEELCCLVSSEEPWDWACCQREWTECRTLRETDLTREEDVDNIARYVARHQLENAGWEVHGARRTIAFRRW